MKIASTVFAVFMFGGSLFSGLTAMAQGDAPGTRAYFETYIEGRYGYTNNTMFKIKRAYEYGAVSTYITGSIVQIIDKHKLLFMKIVKDKFEYSPSEIEPVILLVDDAGQFSEGKTVSVRAQYVEKYACTTPDGQTNTLNAYRTPVPHAITFSQYEALVKAGIQTPDRIQKVVTCEALPPAERSGWKVRPLPPALQNLSDADRPPLPPVPQPRPSNERQQDREKHLTSAQLAAEASARKE